MTHQANKIVNDLRETFQFIFNFIKNVKRNVFFHSHQQIPVRKSCHDREHCSIYFFYFEIKRTKNSKASAINENILLADGCKV